MIESDIAVGTGLRITCSKDALVQGLTLVGRAVSSRTAIQILSGILLEARDGELHLAATDMELSLRATVPAQVEGDGAVVLPGRTLVDIARLLRARTSRSSTRLPSPSCILARGARATHSTRTTPRTSPVSRS